MLDLDHPMTRHIFAAARAEDVVLALAKKMTIETRQERNRLRDSCAPALAELERLGREHFADRAAIFPAIYALERSLAELAGLLQVPEQGSPAEYKCRACGADLKRRGKYGRPAPERPTDVYCSSCLNIIMPALLVLRSGEGFATDFI